MNNMIVVGTGDVFRRFLAPSLQVLGAQGLVRLVATVDIKARAAFEYVPDHVEHRVRSRGEALSSVLRDLHERNPIVVLAHDNDLHYEDAKDVVEAGFRVMIEKPYVVDKNQLHSLSRLMSVYPQQVFLMGYYFMRKMAPLFLVAGMIRNDSFYVETEEVFDKEKTSGDVLAYSGKLEDLLGDPVSLEVKTLESAGVSGRLDQRGGYVFDARRGGGMIQDMGIHALLPLLVLDSYLGRIDSSFSGGEVRTAVCKECYDRSKSAYSIPEQAIAETYAEIALKTDRGVSVRITVGKYTADAPVQKNVILKGKRGMIDMDMNEHILDIYAGDSIVDRIALVNTPGRKYYPVVRAGLEYFRGYDPFTCDFAQKQLDAQLLTLNILERSRADGDLIPMYENGADPETIFQHYAENVV